MAGEMQQKHDLMTSIKKSAKKRLGLSASEDPNYQTDQSRRIQLNLEEPEPTNLMTSSSNEPEDREDKI